MDSTTGTPAPSTTGACRLHQVVSCRACFSDRQEACSLHHIVGCGSCFSDSTTVKKEVRTRYVPPHLRAAAAEDPTNDHLRRSLEALVVTSPSTSSTPTTPATRERGVDVVKLLQSTWSCKKGDLIAFDEEDPYNGNVRVTGWLCSKTNYAYDNMCITSVAGTALTPPHFLLGQLRIPVAHKTLFAKELTARGATHASLVQYPPGAVLLTVFTYHNGLCSARTPLQPFTEHVGVRELLPLGGIASDEVEVWGIWGKGVPAPTTGQGNLRAKRV
jgi:hypothetical protein